MIYLASCLPYCFSLDNSFGIDVTYLINKQVPYTCESQVVMTSYRPVLIIHFKKKKSSPVSSAQLYNKGREWQE